MERIADAFSWPFRDPDWLPKVLVMGLILLVPVLGAMAGLGWMLAALDRLRAGEPSIGTRSEGDVLVIGVWIMQPGEAKIVARRLRDVLENRS